ncbi:MAG: hypothetical protein IPN14_11740 [Bacteroidetes bacterium]|nr:hypothetical protein [Bacteroidota bacterium]
MMHKKATLAIYGIKDVNEREHSGWTHDHNICLMQNGTILKYLHLERLSRKKHDNRLDLYLEEIIDNNSLELPDEFDIVSVNSILGSAFISKNGRIRFEANIEKKLNPNLVKSFAWYQKTKFKGSYLNAFNCSHELAHIATCIPFFGVYKENSLLIHFDGGASKSNFSAFIFKNNKIRLVEYSWDLRYLARLFFSNVIVFKILNAKQGEHHSVPGKLMGYSCLGDYDPKIENWLKKNDYFNNYWDNPELILQSINIEFGLKFSAFDSKETFFKNVASTMQEIFKRELINKITTLQIQTNTSYLYYSGGSALNILTNSAIIATGQFLDVFIPPSCNDSGLSIGAASLLEIQKGNTINIHNSYLNNIELNNKSVNLISNELLSSVSEIIINKGIIGICNGNGEIGPRALGNRSIICLANNKELAIKVSTKIKKREWYRPMAPIMLSGIAKEVSVEPIHHLSKFMLVDYNIKEQYRQSFEGVLYLTKTARIQTIDKESENPFIHSLLKYLYEKHNVLGLINTSFNSHGEPIVHSEVDARKAGITMGLDAIIINNNLVILK